MKPTNTTHTIVLPATTAQRASTAGAPSSAHASEQLPRTISSSTLRRPSANAALVVLDVNVSLQTCARAAAFELHVENHHAFHVSCTSLRVRVLHASALAGA